MNGAVGYSTSTEIITLSDLPTISFCLDLDYRTKQFTYGNEVSVDLQLTERIETTVTLKEEESVSTVFGLEIHLSELRQAKSITDELSSYILKCYKVSFKTYCIYVI